MNDAASYVLKTPSGFVLRKPGGNFLFVTDVKSAERFSLDNAKFIAQVLREAAQEEVELIEVDSD